VTRVLEVESSNPKGRPNLTQRCNRFATASTSTQVAVLPWRYDAEMSTANSLHALAYNTTSTERFGLMLPKIGDEVYLVSPLLVISGKNFAPFLVKKVYLF